MDRLNKAGLETKEAKRKRERKKSILHDILKSPVIESHARLAMLGAAKKRKNAGRSIAGRVLPPANRWYSVMNNTR